MSAMYDYLSYRIGRAAWPEFAAHIRNDVVPALAGSGTELVGLFSPQLGFASNEAIILVRRHETISQLPASFREIDTAAIVGCEGLFPTTRPRPGDRLRDGGIYVHRWFTIDGNRTEDFVDLSNRAWLGFEGAYDTEIFGLFRANASPEDQAEKAARFLLLTWYKNHAVWEASREQPRDPKSLFAQRHQLTRTTIGRSSVRVL